MLGRYGASRASRAVHIVEEHAGGVGEEATGQSRQQRSRSYELQKGSSVHLPFLRAEELATSAYIRWTGRLSTATNCVRRTHFKRGPKCAPQPDRAWRGLSCRACPPTLSPP